MLSASIAFDWSNALCAKPKPLYKQKKSKHARRNNLVCLLFFCWFSFRVMRLVCTRRYEFATQTLWYDCPSNLKLGVANHNYAKHIITHHLPVRAIIASVICPLRTSRYSSVLFCLIRANLCFFLWIFCIASCLCASFACSVSLFCYFIPKNARYTCRIWAQNIDFCNFI